MYKNIIFDMGNVLIDYVPEYILSNFTTDAKTIDVLATLIFHDETWSLLDKGELTWEEAKAITFSRIPKELHALSKEVYDYWFDYKEENKEMLMLIKKLKEQGYKLFVCSNAASNIHEYKDRFEVFKYFDDIVFSADIKIAKPDNKIFHYLLHKNHLEPAQCLFVDDLLINIKAAKRCGIAGYHYNGNVNLFTKYLQAIDVLKRP
ncbi:MAG: HAD family hydrolase [Breznakia sp.]